MQVLKRFQFVCFVLFLVRGKHGQVVTMVEKMFEVQGMKICEIVV